MSNRLPYETAGGNLSPTDTFKQLIENLRLAEEDARELSKLKKLAKDDVHGHMWKAIADNLQRVQHVTSDLANSKTRSSTGYHGKTN